MSWNVIPRPGPEEYAPQYAGYVSRVPHERVRELLANQIAETAGLLGRVKADREGFRYAPGKWTIREVTGHIADTERVMAYRLLRIARHDTTPLPGFDENAWMSPAGFEQRRLADLVEELQAVRAATLKLIDGLPGGALPQRGEASGKVVSAGALAYIIAGHELHHVAILNERYGLA